MGGHHSCCIFGTRQETRVSSFEDCIPRTVANPRIQVMDLDTRGGRHGSLLKEDLAEVLAEASPQVSGQPGASAIAAQGASPKAMAAAVCMEHPESGCAPHPLQVCLLDRISLKERMWGDTPLRLRLVRSLSWCQTHAPPSVVSFILQGVQEDHPLPDSLSMFRRERSPEDLLLAQQILEDDQQVGAVRQVTDPGNTKHLVPWFIISKEEQGGMKHRFITDCRELNRFLQPQEFCLDHFQTIFPYLRKGWVAVKVDLKDAYFHMRLAPTLSQFVRVQVGDVEWEFLVACFGLSTLPQLFMLLMKVLEKIWRA